MRLPVFMFLMVVLTFSNGLKAYADQSCLPQVSVNQKTLAVTNGGYSTVWSFSGETYESGNFSVVSTKLSTGETATAVGSWLQTCYQYTAYSITEYAVQLTFNGVSQQGIVSGSCSAPQGTPQIDGMIPCSTNGWYSFMPNTYSDPLWIVKYGTYSMFIGLGGVDNTRSPLYIPYY